VKAFLGTSLWIKGNYIYSFTRGGIKSVKAGIWEVFSIRRRFYNRKFCSSLAEENAKHVSLQYVKTGNWREEIFSTKWLSINEVSGGKEVLNCTK
jgi:hypothetical protein